MPKFSDERQKSSGSEWERSLGETRRTRVRKTVIEIHCMRNKSIFNERENE